MAITEVQFKISRSDLEALVGVIVQERGPLRFRQIEAYVVLAGYEISTYDVQHAVSRVEELGAIIQDNDFLYRIM